MATVRDMGVDSPQIGRPRLVRGLSSDKRTRGYPFHDPQGLNFGPVTCRARLTGALAGVGLN
jgi:hypothetical protein